MDLTFSPKKMGRRAIPCFVYGSIDRDFAIQTCWSGQVVRLVQAYEWA